jgi:hypothetical protein
VERVREVEASERLLFHETEAARGEEKGPCGCAAAAATVDNSSMVADSPRRGGDRGVKRATRDQDLIVW